MQEFSSTRCLILACGNPLRSDDGVGPWLVTWAQERFGDDPSVRIMYRQQWTPELADNLSRAKSAIFIDASTAAAPGAVELHRVKPAGDNAGIATHHLDAAQLLALCEQLYEAVPANSLLLTIGIASTEFGETFSPPVHEALDTACAELEKLVFDPEYLSSAALTP